jgi:L-fuconolactonase
MTIDAHIHLWDTGCFDLPWLAAEPRLAPRYTADDFARASDGAAPDSAVAVQAGTSATEAAWLLRETEHASEAPRFGVVLQFAPSADGPLGEVQPAVDEGRMPLGVRLPLRGEPEDWTSLPGVSGLAAHLETSDMILELLLRPDQLTAAEHLAARHPGLTVVLCHLGLSEDEPSDAWRQAIARIAGQDNVYAKLSGLFSSAPPLAADLARARSATEWALECFGADRLMFGSDWPISTRAGSYAEVLSWTREVVSAATPSESTAIFGGTAARVYAHTTKGTRRDGR